MTLLVILEFGLMVFIALQATEFVFTYHIKTEGAWKETEMGRHIFVFMCCMAIVLFASALEATSRLLDTESWEAALDWMQVATLATVPFVLAWRRRLLAKAQRQDLEPGGSE